MPTVLSRENSILTAKVIALCGSGIITGGILSLSYFTTPALLLAPSPTAQRQWSHVYNSGKKTMPLLSLLTSSAYIFLSRLYTPSSTVSPRPPLLHYKPFLYLLSAAFTLSIAPYTMIFMRSNITGLERAGQVLSLKAKSTEEEVDNLKVVEGRTTKQLLDQWGLLNLGRAALTGVGFALGVWGSLIPIREVIVEVVGAVGRS